MTINTDDLVFLLTDIVFFADAGGAIVFGGGEGSSLINGGEGLGMRSPPDAETEMYPPILVAVNNQVFRCEYSDCYMYDIEQKHPQWRKVQLLPIDNMYKSSAVAVGSHIWFFRYNTLYDFDTATGLTEEINLPFSASSDDCFVANATHSYIVVENYETGNGSEIWVNPIASYPFYWKHVATLPTRVWYSYCLMFKDQLYIAGGSYPRTNLTFVVDVNTYTVQQLADLTMPRGRGQAMVLDCKPAVVGGRDRLGDEYLSSIEVYDDTTNEWIVHGLSLQTRKSDFGLVQFIF